MRGAEALAEHRRRLGGGTPRLDGSELLALAQRIELRGRGGAGFPFAAKFRAVADAARVAGVAHVVANAAEGEPASVKDRYLLATRPHLVLDGVILAAAALPTGRVILYLTEPAVAGVVEAALTERQAVDGGLPVEIAIAPARYVSGEESAAVRALNTGDARPTDKPPRPFECGVLGQPTLISNVETFAQLAIAARRSAEPATLVTVTPDHGDPTLLEVRPSHTINDALEAAGLASASALLVGGFFGGFLAPALWTTALDHTALRSVGSSLGCAALLALTTTCPVAAVAEIVAFFDRENARQCGACINGTRAMADVLMRLCLAAARPEDLANLSRWAGMLAGRGACGTLDAATVVVGSLLREHDVLVRSHVDGRCMACAASPPDRTRTRFDLSWSQLWEECA